MVFGYFTFAVVTILCQGAGKFFTSGWLEMELSSEILKIMHKNKYGLVIMKVRENNHLKVGKNHAL